MKRVVKYMIPSVICLLLRMVKKGRYFVIIGFCHAIAQAVIYQLPTIVARVPVQVSSYRISGGQNITSVGFLQVLQFPVSNSHSTSRSTLIISHPGLV
jgi:hypothetical protein